MAFRELMIRKMLLGIDNLMCSLVKAILYICFPTGVLKTELKLATYLEMQSTEEDRECAIGP